MCIQNGGLVIISRLKKRLRRLISVRVIVMLSIFLVGVCLLEGFRVYLIASYQEEQVEEQRINLQYFCTRLSGQLGVRENGGLSISSDLELEMELLADMYAGRIMVIDSQYKIVKDSYLIDENKTVASPEVFQCFEGKIYSHLNREEHYMELLLPVTDNITKEVIAVMFVSSSTMSIYNNVNALNGRVVLVEGFLIILLALLAIGLGQLVSSPFRKTRESLERIGDGNLDAQLYHSHIWELAQLTEEYEQILEKLRYQDQSRQEFVSNVSHELKTPIASMKVLSDSLLLQEEVPAELYREFMTDISEELDRETCIINDLLTLTRLDHSSADMLQVTSLKMNTLLEQVMKRLRPLAQKRNVELVFESNRDVTAEADETKLSLAFSNLIENAIKYNRENGWVKVILDADHKYCYVKVVDSGIGIPQESLPNIFDRFYRVDKARSRESGGTGLGLAITRNIILLHNGAIRVTSVLDEGTTFTVRIPLNYLT